jgi:hypothetical protein
MPAEGWPVKRARRAAAHPRAEGEGRRRVRARAAWLAGGEARVYPSGSAFNLSSRARTRELAGISAIEAA